MRRTAVAVLAAPVALVLAGCGGSGSSTPQAGGGDSSSLSTSASGGPSSPASSSAYPEQAEGVRLTPPGSQLRLGQTARMTWKPDQKTVGVVAISVTAVQRKPISAFSDWKLDAATRRSTPYFVHATVRNLGRSNLSGKAVPLYLLDQRNTLLEASSFQARYAACPSRPLPARFTRGRKTSVCLVYFVPDHGRLVAISFRPAQEFDAITWQGRSSTTAGKHHQHAGHRHHKKHDTHRKHNKHKKHHH